MKSLAYEAALMADKIKREDQLGQLCKMVKELFTKQLAQDEAIGVYISTLNDLRELLPEDGELYNRVVVCQEHARALLCGRA